MTPDEVRVGTVITGPLLPEPIEVHKVTLLGDLVKIVGEGIKSEKTYKPVLSLAQLAQLRCSPLKESFDGDPNLFRLGIEAQRLGLAYEYDPYFSLSIARADPLPHQLEAVYGYFLKLPRIRFLLADDPGAGKTIMAGLLIKELNAETARDPGPGAAGLDSRRSGRALPHRAGQNSRCRGPGQRPREAVRPILPTTIEKRTKAEGARLRRSDRWIGQTGPA